MSLLTLAGVSSVCVAAVHPSAATAVDALDAARLQLAAGKRYSLAVLQGAATGQIYPIAKPRITLGRTGCDINLDDAEASRQHASVEVLGDHAILRDLGSTNGTFVDSQRIQQHVLVQPGRVPHRHPRDHVHRDVTGVDAILRAAG